MSSYPSLKPGEYQTLTIGEDLLMYTNGQPVAATKDTYLIALGAAVAYRMAGHHGNEDHQRQIWAAYSQAFTALEMAAIQDMSHALYDAILKDPGYAERAERLKAADDFDTLLRMIKEQSDAE